MEYRIECEECEEPSILQMDTEPQYCPNCGRRADAEALREPINFDDLDDDVISPDGC
jgi:hypothetical protein